MSLDAEPISLTKRGRIVIEPDGRIMVSDFDGEHVTCREVCVLALGWAIQHLTAEMMKDIEKPGGSQLVCEATVPDWASGPPYDVADALYRRGYDDRQRGRDEDPRGTEEWQAVVDALERKP